MPLKAINQNQSLKWKVLCLEKFHIRIFNLTIVASGCSYLLYENYHVILKLQDTIENFFNPLVSEKVKY